MHIDPAPSGAMTSVSRLIHAPRAVVYQALLQAEAVAAWLPPDTMTGVVHTFEPWAGGRIHMSLHYPRVEDTPDGLGGKSAANTDTFRGRFVELIAEEKVVWRTEFEAADPAFAGEMTLTWRLAEAAGGTMVSVECENIPSGIRPEDNEAGSRSSLAQLAAYVE